MTAPWDSARNTWRPDPAFVSAPKPMANMGPLLMVVPPMSITPRPALLILPTVCPNGATRFGVTRCRCLDCKPEGVS